MQVLCSAFDLIADVRELDLTSGLQALFDRDLKNSVLGALLSCALVVRLALDLKLLGGAAVQLFQAHRQRLLDDCDFWFWGSPATTESTAFTTSAATHATHSARHAAHTEATEVEVITAAAAIAHELAKDVVGVGEVEAVPAAACREVERSCAAGHTAGRCEGETSTAACACKWVATRTTSILLWYAAA